MTTADEQMQTDTQPLLFDVQQTGTQPLHFDVEQEQGMQIVIAQPPPAAGLLYSCFMPFGHG